jgi:hypothetical protein
LKGNENVSNKGYYIEHPLPKGVILRCGKGDPIDLSGVLQKDTAAAGVVIDTTCLTNPIVRIDFNCILSYSLRILEVYDLVFTLYRRSRGGKTVVLESWPYRVMMDQALASVEGEQYAHVILEKSESLSLSYCDRPGHGGMFIYVMKVNAKFCSAASVIMHSGFISTAAQSVFA